MSSGAREIYLDHDASAPLRPEAREALIRALDAGPGNASSPHGAGRRLRKILGDARVGVAALIGARPDQVVFTAGTSESNALALRGGLAALEGATPRLITTHAEHEGLLALAAGLEAGGALVERAAVDRAGRYAAAEVARLAGDAACVVAVCAAQSVTGAVQDVAAVAAAVPHATLLVDAAQAVGKIPVDVAAFGCDLLSFSAHKIGGPHGIGALFVRDDAVLRLPGGPTSQERGRRPGTEAVALAAGFGAAARIAGLDLGERAASWRTALAPLDALVASDVNFTRISPGDGLPNTRLVHVAGCPGDALLAALDSRGIRVSTGSACASGARTPPHVLLAAGYPHDMAVECLRISIGDGTRAAAIEALVAALRDVAPRVRAAFSGAPPDT